MWRFILGFSLFAAPAFAWSPCDDLWFARNQVFARAGYCFASPLGQAVFGNKGCIGKDVTLEPGGAEAVAFAREGETMLECKIDTSRTRLDIPHLALRLRLEAVPVLDSMSASGCLDWQGPTLQLRLGPRSGAEVIAEVGSGDDIVWEYWYFGIPDGWSFLSLYRDSRQIGFGWSNAVIDEALCGHTAG
jgi:hypothetical protein